MLFKDRFKIETTVDQGRFGTVCRAIDVLRSSPGLVHRVTLTVLPAESTANERVLGRFKRELERVRNLVHPNIGRVYDLDCDGKTYFVTSEFIDGETLRDVVDNLRPELLEPHEVDGVVRKLGEALAHAHELDIVHGSVRAENVVVTMDHDIKLIGFLSLSSIGVSEPSAELEQGTDICDLAGLAYSLYTGLAPPRSGLLPRIKGVPKRRRRALEDVLLGDPGWSVREFLARAGLAGEPVRAPTPKAPPPAPAPISTWRPEAAPISSWRGEAVPSSSWRADPAPIPTWRPNAAPSSPWRVVVPGLAVVAIVAVAFRGGDVETWLEATLTDFGTGRPQSAEQADAARAPSDGTLAPANDAAAGSSASPAVGTVTRRSAAPPSNKPDRASVAALGVPVRGANGSARERPAERAVARLSLSQPALTVVESESVATVEIRRIGAIDDSLDLIWWTSDGTATARNDYASFGSRVETIGPGEETLTLVIPIVSDAIAETEEFFHVHLDPGPNGAKAGEIVEATVTIIDDDR